MITEAQIQAIVRRVAEGYAPDRIILFGAYAYGELPGNSDLDLLVLKSGIGPERQEREPAVRCLVRGAGVPMDILVRTPTEAAATAQAKCSVEVQAFNQGCLLCPA